MKTTLMKPRGFTLIELLIVIAIIAILSGIIITNLTSTRAKSRDGKRVSDISQIQLALEQYFDRCQQYPSAITNPTAAIVNGCPSGVNLSLFISQIPTPPSAATYDYVTYNPTGNGPTDYILHTQLETQVEALNSSLKSGSGATTPSWYTNNNCYMGNTTPPFNYCIGSR